MTDIEVTCPKCKEELDGLMQHYQRRGVHVSLLGEGLYWDETEYGDYPELEDGFECPHCEEILAETEKEAIALLNGKKQGKIE